jgi:uncharacterized protein (TIGR03437 family)
MHKRVVSALFLVIATVALAEAQSAISVAGVVNAASFAQGAIAPGSMISIFGTGLAPSTLQASSLPLPTRLNGTSIAIAGQNIPLIFVSTTQVNAQLPFQLSSGSAVLTVQNGSGLSASRTITIAPTSPAVFTTTSDGKGDAITVHANFSPVRRVTGESAQTGETIILFCTGLGAVNNFSSAGSAAPSSPLATTIQTPTVLMDGRSAQVTFSGLAPGFVGLYQINLVVPQGVGGDVLTTVNVGSTSSNPVVINVRGIFTIFSNYSGTVEYRTGQKYQIEWNGFLSQSATTFGGNYRLLSGTSVLDSGSVQLQNTSPVFVGSGRSTLLGGVFAIGMDTLDAGKSFFGILYDAASIDQVKDFDAYYASFTVTKVTPVPPPAPPVTGITATCASLEGTLVYSGTVFLGRVTSNTFAADSLGNPYGAYGSPYSSTSIFNTFGLYGSQFSSTSAFNDLASTPPTITNGVAAAYLTTNQVKTPRIDPRTLYPCIGK